MTKLSAPTYIEHLDGVRLLCGATSAALALDVTTRQIGTWRSRHDRNGFPLGVWVTLPHHDRQTWCVDEDELRTWRDSYVPSRGGAPAGANNGAWKNGRRRRVVDGQRVRTS